MEEYSWPEAADGPHTVESLGERLKEMGFSARRVHYPSGTWIPPHTSPEDTIVAVFLGSLVVRPEGGKTVRIGSGEAVEFSAGEMRDLEAKGGIGAVTVHGARSAARTPVWRYLVLAGLAAAANIWSWIQFGSQYDRLVLVNTLIALVPAILDLADRGTRVAYRALWRSWIARLVSNQGLAIIGGVLVLLTGLSSSVVYRSTTPGPLRASVSSLATSSPEVVGGRWAAPETATRFWRWTSPFGRELFFQVDGYRPEPVTLFPWLPSRLATGDLTPFITVLLRIDPGLPNSGWVGLQADWEAVEPSHFMGCREQEVCFPLQEASAADESVAETEETTDRPATVHWGFYLNAGVREIPASAPRRWQADLGADPNRAYHSWLRPAEAPQLLDVEVDDRIDARLYAPLGGCLGEIRHQVTRERFQELYLRRSACTEPTE